MLAGMGLVSAVTFSATATRMCEAQADTLAERNQLMTGLIAVASAHGKATLPLDASLVKRTIFKLPQGVQPDRPESATASHPH